MRRALILLLPAIAVSGCRNACQQLCNDIAQYAEEDCGFTVSSDEIRQCISDHAFSGSPEEQRAICQEFGDQLREEWTCEDLEAYLH